jgi:hypothetical protein
MKLEAQEEQSRQHSWQGRRFETRSAECEVFEYFDHEETILE